MRILLAYEMAPATLAQFRARLSAELSGFEGWELHDWPGSDEALAAQLPLADVILGPKVTPEQLMQCQRLQLWINPWAGVQQIVGSFQQVRADWEAAQGRPLLLANSHGNAYQTAQHGAALTLALCNQLARHDSAMRRGEWRLWKDDWPSTPLRGRTLGLLGYGHLGQHIHRFLSGFELDFIALKREWRVETADAGDTAGLRPLSRRYDSAELLQFCSASDIIVCTLPATPATEGLIGEAQLAALGPQGLLVNLGRGSVLQEAALYHALREGTIAGAAIDVWYNYRPEADAQDRLYPYDAQAHPFHELPNLLLSPHRAASPLEEPSRWDDVVENLRRACQGRRDFLSLVDIAAGY
ncbi:hypothetical protein IT575_10545 [bacterium]|nr:hypothetical protein [bacterium]